MKAAEAGFRAIAIDMRGYGESSAPAEAEAYTPYQFAMMRPDADAAWADAAVTVPGMLYWTSGEAPDADRWHPFDPSREMLRRAPPAAPRTIEHGIIVDAVAAFARTGFHGPLNYYRALDAFTRNSAAFAGARIAQPSMFPGGALDGLNLVASPDAETMRGSLSDLRSFTMLDRVGHWPQLEAPDRTNATLLAFLRSL